MIPFSELALVSDVVGWKEGSRSRDFHTFIILTDIIFTAILFPTLDIARLDKVCLCLSSYAYSRGGDRSDYVLSPLYEREQGDGAVVCGVR